MIHEANNRLAGRTALVTGAGSPAGRAICERFARQGAWIVAVGAAYAAAEATAGAARAVRVPALAALQARPPAGRPAALLRRE